MTISHNPLCSHRTRATQTGRADKKQQANRLTLTCCSGDGECAHTGLHLFRARRRRRTGKSSLSVVGGGRPRRARGGCRCCRGAKELRAFRPLCASNEFRESAGPAWRKAARRLGGHKCHEFTCRPSGLFVVVGLIWRVLSIRWRRRRRCHHRHQACNEMQIDASELRRLPEKKFAAELKPSNFFWLSQWRPGIDEAGLELPGSFRASSAPLQVQLGLSDGRSSAKFMDICQTDETF